MLLVTGGCGFIGSGFILGWLQDREEAVLNLDLLTYAGHPGNLAAVAGDPRYSFVHGDIGDQPLVTGLLAQYRPRAIMNFAAESHVDRSISMPQAFVETNVAGTVKLLEAVQTHWQTLPPQEAGAFRFLHVSTDEVYGSLSPDEPPFRESHCFKPNSPYSASKAASDHFVRAWHHTFGLPTLTTHCSNNYGPRQFPEKLIPLMIRHALRAEPLPIYGDGQQVRDWLHVDDHCEALETVLERGRPGESYNIGGRAERANLEVVKSVCAALDTLVPAPGGRPRSALITHVQDRRGHDRRYAIDNTKIAHELGWEPRMAFEQGIRLTVQWYLEHQDWVESVTSGSYRHWVKDHPARGLAR
jgi:dTDP-glucose 4,6-dehydratase